eukprot:TRINITY_DN2161_c0_g1_i1.p1 TRINITY_DN2161_c0_g1~~TRINITY_DN2161_c0_g1_i1.p1  ORF type:complete len:114 (+),score=20.28 TRINITY_DN2161_c0_g1_i1:304-645(+)
MSVSNEAPTQNTETPYSESAKVELIEPVKDKPTKTREFKTTGDLPSKPSDQIYGGALENDPSMPATDQSAFPVATTSYEEVRHPKGEVEGVPKLFKGQTLNQGTGEAKKQTQS